MLESINILLHFIEVGTKFLALWYLRTSAYQTVLEVSTKAQSGSCQSKQQQLLFSLEILSFCDSYD